MALRKPHSQRTLLRAHETATTQFIEDFRVSNRMYNSLQAERKSCAPLQQQYLKMRARQHAYVEDAQCRELPPIDRVVDRQERLCELRRDAHHLRPKVAETPAQSEKRLAQREVFMASRKMRHDDACEIFARSLDALADECDVSAQEAKKKIKEYIANTDAQISDLVKPLESEDESATQRSESDIQRIKANLERIIEARRVRIGNFQNKLADIDSWRRKEAAVLLSTLVESLRHAAHVSLEEAERMIEDRASQLNDLLLANQKAARAQACELMITTLEVSKEYKKRWHAGLVSWREKQKQAADAAAADAVDDATLKIDC